MNVKEVTSIEGDVTLGNRKGKVYNLYDLTITLAWEGRLADEPTSRSNGDGPEAAAHVRCPSRVEDHALSRTGRLGGGGGVRKPQDHQRDAGRDRRRVRRTFDSRLATGAGAVDLGPWTWAWGWAVDLGPWTWAWAGDWA